MIKKSAKYNSSKSFHFLQYLWFKCEQLRGIHEPRVVANDFEETVLNVAYSMRSHYSVILLPSHLSTSNFQFLKQIFSQTESQSFT